MLKKLIVVGYGKVLNIKMVIKKHFKNYLRGIYTKLAKEYNVTPQTIFSTAKGITWKHI